MRVGDPPREDCLGQEPRLAIVTIINNIIVRE